MAPITTSKDLCGGHVRLVIGATFKNSLSIFVIVPATCALRQENKTEGKQQKSSKQAEALYISKGATTKSLSFQNEDEWSAQQMNGRPTNNKHGCRRRCWAGDRTQS